MVHFVSQTIEIPLGMALRKRAMQNVSGSFGMMRRYVDKTTRCPLCFQTDIAMQTTDGKFGRSGDFFGCDAMTMYFLKQYIQFD